MTPDGCPHYGLVQFYELVGSVHYVYRGFERLLGPSPFFFFFFYICLIPIRFVHCSDLYKFGLGWVRPFCGLMSLTLGGIRPLCGFVSSTLVRSVHFVDL